MSTVIKVENLSKQYRLGLVGSGTFKEDTKKWWAKIRGKENPYAFEGEENNRSVKGMSDYVWSLKDINFEVQQGDVLGIIGRNGAGKSTLLKILSKVTAPTTGSIKAKGRIASLLEVGTGFHPELTGKENIYLNGAILGMRKHEIKSKLDEIIAFAGVERYIDTPVKRYSSGMYVRLAFAVAAHLENEILIIDEVLAVGDAEFQKKCLAKMGDVSKGEGRTVLFVSHNMSAMKTIAQSCLVLENGMILERSNNVNDVINNYLYDSKQGVNFTWEGDNYENKYVKHLFSGIKSIDEVYKNLFYNNEEIILEVCVEIKVPNKDLVIAIVLKNSFETPLMKLYFDDFKFMKLYEVGIYKVQFIIPKYTLAQGEYYISFDIAIHNFGKVSTEDSDLYFKVLAKSELGNRFNFVKSYEYNSIIRPDFCHSIIKIN